MFRCLDIDTPLKLCNVPCGCVRFVDGRGRPDKFPKWSAKIARQPKTARKVSGSGALEKLSDVRKIAVDSQIHVRDLPATTCTICKGNRRLMSPQNASLMVVGSTAWLHTCGSSDWEHLCDLIYIIGLGLPVVMASTWRIAGGDPSRLVSQASGVFFHAPAATQKACTFMLGKQLADAHPNLMAALRHCAKHPNSKWAAKIVKDIGKGQPLAANHVRANDVSQLAAAVIKLRTLGANWQLPSSTLESF